MSCKVRQAGGSRYSGILLYLWTIRLTLSFYQSTMDSTPEGPITLAPGWLARGVSMVRDYEERVYRR